VCNDLTKDVIVHKELLKDSESKREQLQIHITNTAHKVKSDASENRQSQDQIIAENESLRFEIQQLKAYHSKREQEWLHQLEDTNIAHKNKVDSMTRENTENFNNLNSETQSKIERLQREQHDKLTQVT
jgi:hypothetical protein